MTKHEEVIYAMGRCEALIEVHTHIMAVIEKNRWDVAVIDALQELSSRIQNARIAKQEDNPQ